MPERNEWIERFTVRSYEVDPDGTLRLSQLTRMLQEAAWQHAKALGKGFADRTPGALYWVLSRLRIRVRRLPSWGERFTVTTWPVGMERILATREFRLQDDTGEVLARALSGWLVVESSAGRPVRPERLVGEFRLEPAELAVDLARLPEEVPGEPPDAAHVSTQTREVRLHDIDQYRHANNSSYLEWMLDALPAEFTFAHSIVEVDLDFLKETLLGQSVDVCSAIEGHRVVGEVRHAGDTRAAARARLLFRPSA